MFSRRTAHVYIEILAVITIIGVLVSLLLPAVNMAREASRRIECSSNLTQLIVALQNYEMAHTCYPPGTVNDTGPIRSTPQGYHHNWIIQILPFVDERSLADNINPNFGVYHPVNARARSIAPPLLRCPSDFDAQGPVSNYAGVHHDAEAPIDVTNNGMLFLNSRMRFDDMRDGASFTVIVGEKAVEPGDLGWMSGTRATLRNAGWPLLGPGPGGTKNALLEELEKEGAVEVPLPQTPKQKTLFVGGFSSRHPGGSLFAYGDGSVQFARGITAYLAHRADGAMTE